MARTRTTLAAMALLVGAWGCHSGGGTAGSGGVGDVGGAGSAGATFGGRAGASGGHSGGSSAGGEAGSPQGGDAQAGDTQAGGDTQDGNAQSGTGAGANVGGSSTSGGGSSTSGGGSSTSGGGSSALGGDSQGGSQAVGGAGAAGSGGTSGGGGTESGGATGGGAAGANSGGAGGASANGGGAGSGGASANGGAGGCSLDADCSSGVCGGGTIKMICVSKSEACQSNDDCLREQYCDGSCKAAAGLGQTCSPGRRCGQVAIGQRQLWCDSQTNTCVGPLPAWSGIGSDCTSATCTGSCQFDAQCPDELPCSYQATFSLWANFCRYSSSDPGTICQPGQVLNTFTNQCMWPTPAQGSCNSQAVCASGLYCGVTQPPIALCLPSPGEGQACITPDKCYNTQIHAGCSPCASGLVCNAGVCQRQAQAGEGCDMSSCATNLYCVASHTNGTCATSGAH